VIQIGNRLAGVPGFAARTLASFFGTQKGTACKQTGLIFLSSIISD
jgi:hypothetical protein